MQNTTKKPGEKKKPLLIYKPMLAGAPMSKAVARRALRVFGYALAIALVYFLLGSMLVFDSALLRVPLNLMLVAAGAAFLYMDAAAWGQADAAHAEIMYARSQEGRAINEADRQKCFHGAKGFAAGLLGILPLFLLAAAYACVATRQSYTLQALPDWVAGYNTNDQIWDALAYYREARGMDAAAVLCVIVRVLVYPFVNIVTAANADALLIVDRLSPLLVLVHPAAYGVGYLQGKRLRALAHGSIAAGARKQKKRAQRERAARQKKRDGNQLI